MERHEIRRPEENMMNLRMNLNKDNEADHNWSRETGAAAATYLHSIIMYIMKGTTKRER